MVLKKGWKKYSLASEGNGRKNAQNNKTITVKSVYCGHLRLLKKNVRYNQLSTIQRFGVLRQKKKTKIKLKRFFNTIRVRNINRIYFEI